MKTWRQRTSKRPGRGQRWPMAAVFFTAALLTAVPVGVVAVAAEPTESLIPRRVLDPLDQCPCWTGRVDALLLWRDAPQGTGLFNTLGPNPAAGINAADLASGLAAGPRFTLFRHTGDLGAIEFNYFRVQSFTASVDTSSQPPGDYVFADGVLCCARLRSLRMSVPRWPVICRVSRSIAGCPPMVGFSGWPDFAGSSGMNRSGSVA